MFSGDDTGRIIVHDFLAFGEQATKSTTQADVSVQNAIEDNLNDERSEKSQSKEEIKPDQDHNGAESQDGDNEVKETEERWKLKIERFFLLFFFIEIM